MTLPFYKIVGNDMKLEGVLSIPVNNEMGSFLLIPIMFTFIRLFYDRAILHHLSFASELSGVFFFNVLQEIGMFLKGEL